MNDSREVTSMPKSYLEPSRTSTMELFAKIVNSFFGKKA